MWSLAFFITTVICAIGWLGQYVSTLTLAYYIEKKEYTRPNTEELKECTEFVVRNLFR